MKSILLAVMFLLAAATAFAQLPTSNLQMQLAADPAFVQRVEYSLIQQAFVVKLNGAGETTACSSQVVNCHTLRSNYAGNVLQASHGWAVQWATDLVGQATLLARVTTCTGTPMVCTTAATDADIFAQISNLWNAVSGVL